MKTKSLFLSLLLMSSIVVFNSCQKDDEDVLSKEEATVAINDTDQDFATVSDEISTSDGYVALEQVYSLNFFNDDSYTKEDAKSQLKSALTEKSAKLLMSKFGGDISLGTDFLDIDFDYYAGTWTYNSYTQSFDYSEVPSDEIVVNYPSPASETNNVTLTYYDYSDTGLKMKIEIDGNQVFYASVSLDNNVYTYVVELGAYKLVRVMTYTETETISSHAIKGSDNLELLKNDVTVYKHTISLAISSSETSGYVKVEAKQIIKSLELRVKVSFTANDMQNTNFDINDAIKISLYTTTGEKIGDFKFEYDSDENLLVYIVFSNGDKELIKEAMPNLHDFEQRLFNKFYSLVMK